MKTVHLALGFLLIAGVIFSCQKNNEPATTNNIITGKLVSNSDCKSNLKSSGLYGNLADTLSCIEYVYDNTKNQLYIKHVNAGFNCCPGNLYCQFNLVGDTIFIEEFETTALCNCNCLFDLEIEIDGVMPQHYILAFIEPYAGNETKIMFGANFGSSASGSYCVTRKNYPWGY